MGLLSRLRPPVTLHAFGRSRRNPVRRKVPQIGKWRLLWGEYLGWRLHGPGPAADPGLLAALPPLLSGLAGLSDAALDLRLAHNRPRAEQIRTAAGYPAFAEALEVMRRATGFTLRPNQIACAAALLAGECVELRTGEGKTLAAGLAALIAARAGVSVHVVTINDYLAARDGQMLAPMAARLGLRLGALRQDMDEVERRNAYDADIVYGTNKGFVFDDLRDRREAQLTPGALPRQTEGEGRARDAAGSWRLTLSGLRALEAEAAAWPHPVARSDEIVQLAEKALAALYQFRRNDAYVVRAGKVEMIDQSTGRLMPDRRWDYGLQQMVEIAAGVAPSPETLTVAQLTQQTYFRQYRLLSGLTGTARECRPEFWSIYALPVRPIAPHAPLRLIDHGLRVFAGAAEKWDHVARRAALIGVNDVTETEALAQVLRARGLEVAVLDALSETAEAELVAQAGAPGRITLATHLAGRGTDIALAAPVRAAGGLHVIIASAMASVRLERQFYGRAATSGRSASRTGCCAMARRRWRGGCCCGCCAMVRRWRRSGRWRRCRPGAISARAGCAA